MALVLLSCYHWGLIDCSLRAMLYLYHSLSNTSTETQSVQRGRTQKPSCVPSSAERRHLALYHCAPSCLVQGCMWPPPFSPLACVTPVMVYKWLGEAQWGDCSPTTTLTPEPFVVSDSSLTWLIPEVDAFQREKLHVGSESWRFIFPISHGAVVKVLTWLYHWRV